MFVCYHFLFDDRNGLLGGQKRDVEPGSLLTLHKVFIGERYLLKSYELRTNSCVNIVQYSIIL